VSKKKKREPTMNELWVMTAVALAFMKEHEIAPVDYFRQYFADQRRLFRKLDAFQRDPKNHDAIMAERVEAARVIGRGETKQ
jgi:hypothetical protein